MREVWGGNLEDDIKQSRVENCYSQAYMANQLGITQSAYYKIEAGGWKRALILYAHRFRWARPVFYSDVKWD